MSAKKHTTSPVDLGLEDTPPAARQRGRSRSSPSARAGREINRALLERGIIGGFDLGRYREDLADCLLLCCTEVTQRSEMDQLVTALKEVGGLS